MVGIGFGPSNLSLAVAIEEHNTRCPEKPVRAVFFERQKEFGWHRNMLLPATTMQIPFLKDIATFRNPLSRYSFVAYLHAAGRLVGFVNNQTFFPTRLEFHQYLEWAAAHFTDRVSYGAEAVGLYAAAPDHLEVEVREGAVRRRFRARNVVLSTGLVPRMPADIACDERVWHSSRFLTEFDRLDRAGVRSVAVVGAGQSAAEITRYLHDELPSAHVYAVVPSYGYALADDTPFANQVFDPAAVDDYYFASDQSRQAFWDYHRNTNYSVVDDDVLRDLYRRGYDEDVRGDRRLHFLNLTRVSEVKRSGDDTRVLLMTGARPELEVDLCVFATGYAAMEPAGLLGDLDRYCPRDEAGHHRVERDYRLITGSEVPGAIYLQGGTEHTHGLSSSLLSNVAVRSGEITDSVVARHRTERRPVPSVVRSR
ncbi:lysine N(6)-hydroxylase/L-ornithine N(5)-oxygenase family protein [Streptomyces anulatus]|uniref:lysine N(6)-hydroxylase/L-ornithine N(5)-oxygenase family protein n=1 Tax=Streptomyces anulatus TaxID=1892 RepID=UPI00368CE70A